MGTQGGGPCAHQGHIFGVLTASSQCPRVITALGAEADEPEASFSLLGL